MSRIKITRIEKKVVFPDRIVLGQGYPWAMGTGPYYCAAVTEHQRGCTPIHLDWPQDLWKPSVPQYRLVLERIPE